MLTCPNCAAQNDDGNRFCDQCGSRLDAPATAAAAAPSPDQPTAAALSCPSCGAAVLSGEAFCDNCGAALVSPIATPAPVTSADMPVSADAPTMLAAPGSLPAASPPADQPPPQVATDANGVAMVVCQVCGHHNLPGDTFCDNCGAALSPASPPIDGGSPASVPSADNAPTVIAPPPAAPDETPIPAPPVAPDDATVLAPSPLSEPVAVPEPSATDAPTAPMGNDGRTAQPVEVAPSETPSPIAPPPPTEPAPTEPAPAEAITPLPPVEPAPAAGVDMAAYETQRSAFEEEIGRQQQIISQFEQMQTMFGAATPPAVTQGLAEAREALTRVQAELGALQPPAPATPAVDPAEVARLEEEMGRQQQIIGQFEQMQTMFGAATPPAVTQGLAEAREALARVQAEFTELTGGLPAASVAPATPAAPAAEPAAATPASPGPRLVIADGGQVLAFPAGKAEIIIGREDPVSNIFPEVDLTSYGGENGGVSRQHARINLTDGNWTITDLNSTNYTRVDGARLDPSVATPLHDGAKVQFGRVATTFHL